MKNYLFIIIFLSQINGNCSDKEPTELTEILSKVNADGKSWIKQWGYDKLNKGDVRIYETKTISFEDSIDDTSTNQLFKVYLDRSHTSYIDIFSGTYYADSTNREVKFLSEPESILKLYSENKLSVLLHYGYSIIFQDAYWIDQNKFIVLGYESGIDNKALPKIWFFNLNTSKYSLYNLSISKKIDDMYVKNKFEQ